jgi:hypothetical protein
MIKSFSILLLILFVKANLSAQVYNSGVPVDSLLYQGWIFDNQCFPDQTASLNFPSSVVTGMDHILIFTNVSVVNSMYVDGVGIINTGDSIIISASQTYFQFYFPSGGNLEFIIKAVGTPIVSGEEHGCNLEVLMTLGECWLFGIYGSFANVCHVDCVSTPGSLSLDVQVLPDLIDPCAVSPAVPTATNDCSTTIEGVADVLFPITDSGTTVITWTYDDGISVVTQTQNVTIGIEDGIVVNGVQLQAVEFGANYQWVDCNDNYSSIPGAVNQFYTPTETGNYAVQISRDTCSVTSDCIGYQVNCVSTPGSLSPDVQVLPDLIDLCAVSPTVPTATNDCSTTIDGVADVLFPITDAGTTVITWTYDDGISVVTQTQNITIDIDDEIVVNGVQLQAVEFGAIYQWVDCNDNYSSIPGAINQFYTPMETGNYAVQITQDTCSVTSDCIFVDFNVLVEKAAIDAHIYPNPTNGDINIESEILIDYIEIIDLQGRLLEKIRINSNNYNLKVTNFEDGHYFLMVHYGNKIDRMKFVKEK